MFARTYCERGRAPVKMVTRKEVAQLAKVSEMTVTRVVTGKGYVSVSARSRVEDAIKQLNYIPNKLASSLVQKNGRSIAVVLQELSNPYYTQLVEDMTERARETGFSVLVFEVKDGEQESTIKEVISNRVCGILNMLMFTKFPPHIRDLLAAYGIRSIFAGAPNRVRFDINYRNAVREAFARLSQAGIRNPVFVLGTDFTEDERAVAFRDCAAECGMELRGDSILTGDYPHMKSYVVGYDTITKFFAGGGKCDAVFCLNDMMALGVMKGVSDAGLRVPEDVSVIGFDNTAMGRYFCPSLTSIGADAYSQAVCFCDYLTGRVSETELFLDAQLFVRGSIR